MPFTFYIQVIVMAVSAILYGDSDKVAKVQTFPDGSCEVIATEMYGSVNGKHTTIDVPGTEVRIAVAYWKPEWCAEVE